MKDIKNTLNHLNDYAIKVNKKNKTDYKMFFKSVVIGNVISKYFSDSEKEEQEYFPEQISLGLQILSNFDCNNIIPIGLLLGLEKILKQFDTEAEEQKLSKEDYVSLLQQAGSEGWMNINPNYIEKYIKQFKLNEGNAFSQKQMKMVHQAIKGLIRNQDFIRAGRYIDAFNISKSFDCRKLAHHLINRDKGELAIRLVEKLEDKRTLKEIISKLNLGKYNALVSNAIKNNGLNPEDFPRIVSHQIYGALMSFVRRHDWYKTEEVALQRYNFYNNKQAMTIFVKILIRNKKYDEAYSVVKRHSEKISEYVIHQLEKKAEPKNQVDNIIWTADSWGPSEVNMKGEDINEYLTLEYFGVKEEDVIFVDDDSTPEFKIATEHLLNATMVSCGYYSQA